MRSVRIVGLVGACAVVLLASILVWMTFDRYLHTTRGTVLTSSPLYTPDSCTLLVLILRGASTDDVRPVEAEVHSGS